MQTAVVLFTSLCYSASLERLWVGFFVVSLMSFGVKGKYVGYMSGSTEGNLRMVVSYNEEVAF